MAMNLRLDEADGALLRALAEKEHRSMNEVVILAIRERAERLAKSERTRAAFERIEQRDAEALDLLSQ
ncbi:hypothetical protein ACFWN7_07555 [Agromyces sp. NPDC058484]|uniref:hypothetical protein n=1 Tax=Agromyces sp. NPDC058484 TaxID=3346524 RepID=UPI003650C60A